jgi:hypothetical protein
MFLASPKDIDEVVDTACGSANGLLVSKCGAVAFWRKDDTLRWLRGSTGAGFCRVVRGAALGWRLVAAVRVAQSNS